MMGSFKLKVENRNKLYFSKFTYRAQCKILGAGYTYYTNDIEAFKDRFERIQKNRYSVRIMGKDWNTYAEEIDLEQINKFFTWRNTVSKDKFLHRIQGDHVSFFSNDLSLLQTLKDIDPDVTFTKAKVLEKDKLYFKKEPKYKYRTYFRAKRMPKDFSENVFTVKDMYKSLNFSKAIFNSLFHNNWHPYRYMSGSNFVEYNDEQMLTILAMWFPDMLAKTYICQKEP